MLRAMKLRAMTFLTMGSLLIALLSMTIWRDAGAAEDEAVLKSLTQDAFQQLDSGPGSDDPPGAIDDNALDAAMNEAKTHSRTLLDKAENTRAPLPTLPDRGYMDDLLNAGPQRPIDVHDLAQQGKRLINPYEGVDEDRYQTRVLVFVSSSLPDTTIQNYLRQTQRIGGAVVFRGLIHNTMQDMRDYLARQIAALNETFGDQAKIEPSILIDPTLFRRFDIDQAPVTVATESDIKPCITDRTPQGCPTPTFHAVRGDVSLAWALGLIARQSDSPTLKARLRPLIKNLEQI